MNLKLEKDGDEALVLINEDIGGGDRNTDINDTVEDNGYVVEGMDGGHPEGRNFSDESWSYIRIYSGTGAGQVAEIEELGKGFVKVNQVWETTSNTIGDGTSDSLYERMSLNYPHVGVLHDYSWFISPEDHIKYVVVANTKMWRGLVNHATFGWEEREFPALWSVKEILEDQALEQTSQEVMNTVSGYKNDIINAMGKDGNNNDYLEPGDFLKLPVLHFGIWDGSNIADALAFFPNMVNCQPVSYDHIVMARQFGPQNEDGDDVLQAAAESIVGANVIRFANDWNLYHRLAGNVHCGTAAKRVLPAENWWPDENDNNNGNE